ncbi:hypothetical protein PWT90_00124 [Aphanocladium album]|nr:hypothetical protein PWT90_00124 [Aphanocladium album]
MSRPIDHSPPSSEHSEQRDGFDLAEPQQEQQKTQPEPETPMRKRELVPRSTVQPSTRRVRRLDGEKLAAANPLFQPWTTESSKKVLDFSRNISPRKAEPKTRSRPDATLGDTLLANRRQTRQPANTTLMNSTLLSYTLSDQDTSSSSNSEIDIGDVTLPASLQLANQPTEFSQRMARLRQDTCITILEDSIPVETLEPERELHIAEVDHSTECEPLEEARPLSYKDANICCQADGKISEQSKSLKTQTSQDAEKENIETENTPIFDEDQMKEQLVDEQLWGNDFNRENATLDTSTGPSHTPLASPRKAASIPQGPHTPTKEGFWKQSLVDCWNDEHSPRKAVKAAMRSPVKQSSPTKASKASFEASKAKIAVEFLRELDSKITEGKISQLAKPTGGVKIEWSKTLSTTAGRANWKKETIRTTPCDGWDATVTYNHHASIELAEKVIDDEGRLLNVLAHEFCHLANFMISGVTNNPHGKEFKQWATKCSQTFASRGIKVTTKHNYEIDFKYIWQCEDCSSSYKRHSKSINTDKHRCGGCKGKLLQIKPAPRNGGKPSEYQLFIKEEMKALKQENPSSPPKVIMQMAAEKWANRPKPVQPARSDAQEDVGDIAAQLLGLSLGE